MAVDISVTYAIGTAGMALGTLALAVGLRDVARSHPLRYASLLGVTGIATVAYAVMTAGLGTVAVGDRTVFVPRYVDWMLTTPLLILYVGLLAGASRRTIGLAVGVDTLVLVLGTAATLTTGAVSYALFGAGSVAFLGLLYLLYRPITAAGRASPDAALFGKLRDVIGVLWLVYPVVWITGPPGLGVMTAEMTALVIVYLDLVTKVGFGVIVLNARNPMAAGADDADGAAAGTGAGVESAD
ncbi:MAG: bacteriorhodopsin [Haloferacaceae archaeon]